MSYWANTKDQEEFTENFIDETAFAKVVNTKDGPALLVAGNVINLSYNIADFNAADALATALRRAAAGDGRISGGMTSATGLNAQKRDEYQP